MNLSHPSNMQRSQYLWLWLSILLHKILKLFAILDSICNASVIVWLKTNSGPLASLSLSLSLSVSASFCLGLLHHHYYSLLYLMMLILSLSLPLPSPFCTFICLVYHSRFLLCLFSIFFFIRFIHHSHFFLLLTLPPLSWSASSAFSLSPLLIIHLSASLVCCLIIFTFFVLFLHRSLRTFFTSFSIIVR